MLKSPLTSVLNKKKIGTKRSHTINNKIRNNFKEAKNLVIVFDIKIVKILVC